MDPDIVSFQFIREGFLYNKVYGVIQLPPEKLVAERLVHVNVNGPASGTYVNLFNPYGLDVDITPVIILEMVPH